MLRRLTCDLQGGWLASPRWNVLAQFHTYIRRMATSKDIRTDFTLTFKEPYLAQIIRQGTAGPINGYDTSSSLLFLRGCADHRVCKILLFEIFRTFQKCGRKDPTIGCMHTPSRQCFLAGHFSEIAYSSGPRRPCCRPFPLHHR